MTFVWTIVSWPCRWHKPHTHKQIQATHCLSSLHPGPALAVTRCHPKSITSIVYVLILFLSLGVTTHGTHKKTSFDLYALSRSWSRLRALVTTSNGVLRLVRTVPVLVSPTSPGDNFKRHTGTQNGYRRNQRSESSTSICPALLDVCNNNNNKNDI